MCVSVLYRQCLYSEGTRLYRTSVSQISQCTHTVNAQVERAYLRYAEIWLDEISSR